MGTEASWELTPGTSKRIDWQAIEDVFGVVAGRQRRAATPPGRDELLSAEDRESARRAFDVAKEEFAKTIGWLRTVMRWAIAGITGAVALAVAGGALVHVSPWASLISIASLGSLFGLLPKALGLARDQVMLELIPTRYTLALELCNTKQDLQKLLARFLDETSSLRKGGSSKSR